MSTLQNRIRRKASRKEFVVITNRKKSRAGFTVVDPDGAEFYYATKREALQGLFAKVRCAPVRQWTLLARGVSL